MAEGRPATGADANFYLHEVSESTMMGRGMPYPAAHQAALAKYGVTEPALYHPEVIKATPGWWSPIYYEFWGIGR